MTGFTAPDPGHGQSSDPNDEQIGDIVHETTVDAAGAYDTVFVGEPYDGVVVGRTGARDAPADLAIVDATTAVHVSYTFGVNTVDTVIKGSRVVHE